MIAFKMFRLLMLYQDLFVIEFSITVETPNLRFFFHYCFRGSLFTHSVTELISTMFTTLPLECITLNLQF